MGGERFDFLDKRDFLEKLLGWAEGSGEQSSQHQQRMCILAVLLHRRWEFFIGGIGYPGRKITMVSRHVSKLEDYLA